MLQILFRVVRCLQIGTFKVEIWLGFKEERCILLRTSTQSGVVDRVGLRRPVFEFHDLSHGNLSGVATEKTTP